MDFFANRVALVRWTSAMLAISALLFATAVLMEGSGHREPASMAAHDEAAGAQEQGGHDEAAESSTAKQGGDSAEVGETGSHAEQTILGINLETPWLVWGFVGVSIMLAAAVLRLGKATLLLAILLAGAAAILDGREVILQLARANASVASLAALTALAHAAVVILAVLAWQAVSTRAGPATGRNTHEH
ncbi:hypothetical protein DBIPINDM_004908 [Mesorhizobium sp. AR02]|uniref:hypothetical protein n=1 Tax=Mesorhizobium sp. AR02 TaxID=2865837 RepID=UPI00215FC0FE|nr:hypothetical protein [Mesorhizobium sp. AR02]UVK51617.1 hypothetical protein DBIPINDM_004908 [Mesorhizobium sp. AR02]